MNRISMLSGKQSLLSSWIPRLWYL